MSYEATIPTHDEDLRINDETTLAEVNAFVAERLHKPAVLGDVVVFNFSSYELDGSALVNTASDLEGGVYVIPYQVPGVWGYIVDALPPEISDTALLTYRQNEGEYHAYQNFRKNAETAEKLFSRIYRDLALYGGDE